ncbi:hypothetical protein LINGRAHAP2_LOCUS3930 [Linum grandiflorum]
MKQQADSGRRDVSYAVGDWVYLKLQPYRQHSVFRRASQKLSCRFYGPYIITERLGPVAYRLGLPEGSRVHPVFHVSLLRRCNTINPSPSSDIPPITDNGSLLLQPEAIIDTRWTRCGSRFVEEVLVKWQSLPADDATWELATVFHDRFVQLGIEDNAVVSEEGNDRLPRSPPSPPHQPRRSTRPHRPNPRFRDE